MRKRLVIVVTFLGGMYFFVRFFLPKDYGGGYLRSWQSDVSRFNIVLYTIAIGLGLMNIFRVYGIKVVKKDKTWLESLVLLVAFAFTFIVGLLKLFGPDRGLFHDPAQPGSGWFNRGYFEMVFNSYIVAGAFIPLGAAMFSLLGFYITRAAFRAFRVRNVEAALVMVSALFIMLGALPIPLWRSVLPGFLAGLRQWLLAGINAGVQRAILIGSGVAWLVMAVRMWFSLDEAGQGRGGVGR